MSKYLLLRNNQQTGPHSLEDLQTRGLRSTDLIWIQGKSDGWTYAPEVEELAGFIEEISNSSPEVQDVSATTAIPSYRGQFTLETKYTRPLDEIKEIYVHHLQKKGKTKVYKTALVLSVLVTLVLSGLLIRKIMDKPEPVQIKIATAPPAVSEPITNSENFQNALSKEFIPIETKPKKAKPKDIKKLVSVQANDYRVKLLGGINDLKLTVQNYSDHLLDKVVVKVDYLKPKGEVINSELVTIRNIKSQDVKTIDVPPSSRGVKIKYTILSIHSQEYKTILEEL
jgi:hypothetical protein